MRFIVWIINGRSYIGIAIIIHILTPYYGASLCSTVLSEIQLDTLIRIPYKGKPYPT